MNAPVISACIAKKVLCIADMESALRIEMQMLSSLGVLSFSFADSVQASLDALSSQSAKHGFGADVVVCSETLEGQPVYLLLQRMADDAALARMPVLLVTATPQSAVLAQQHGLTAIARPYTQNSFGEALSRAMDPMRKPLSKADMNAICASLARKKQTRPVKNVAPVTTTTDMMEEGLRYLRAGALSKAEEVFTAAAKRSYDNAEPLLGLARIKTCQGKKDEAAACLVKAAAAFTRQKNMSKAKVVCDMLPAKFQGSNIFLQEAAVCLQAGEYTGAALSVLEYLNEHVDERLHLVVGRLCQRTSAPDQCIAKLCEAYGRLGYASIAQCLHTQLVAEPTAIDAPRRGWLDRHPRLREVIEVASHTAALWRQARA